ncbi:unnamed protein product, partial [Mycena citricolor]
SRRYCLSLLYPPPNGVATVPRAWSTAWKTYQSAAHGPISWHKAAPIVEISFMLSCAKSGVPRVIRPVFRAEK